jgi:tungstate transport system substrate-binding protein
MPPEAMTGSPSSRLRRRAACLGAVLLLLAAACAPGERERVVRLTTTTSPEDSGLLRALLPPFEDRERIRVQVIAVGTGEALERGRRGDADLVIVHDRAREDAFVAEGHGIERRDLMANDFLIVGPPDDPAGASGAPDAAGALARIAGAKGRFVSRGDRSGTHAREVALWEAAGGRPDADGYVEAGQGMGACLTMADEMRAYTLVDRGTWIASRHRLDLVPLVEGDPALANPYGVILVHPDRHPGLEAEGARRLFEYLTGPEGQQRIGSFRVDGEVLFRPSRSE